MHVKITDVAEKAGVSIATVSLALNGNEKINIRTRRHVAAVAQELGYRPNPSAKRLASRKSRQIGLVLPDIENIYYAALAQDTLNELRMSDYALIISSSMNSRQMERRIVSDMIGNQVEGLMIAPVEKPNDNIEYLDALNDAGIPYVFVTASYPDLEHPCVMCDLYGGMKQLLTRLYDRGLRRMALLSGAQNVHCFDLRDGAFMDFCAEKGLEGCRVYHLDGIRYDDSFNHVRSMALEGLDGILCVNDMMALGAINALKARSLRVPEDIAVAGYDDSIFSRISPVPITTVRQDVRRMAVSAASWMLDCVRGNAPDPENLRLIPCEVQLRRSTER